MLELGVQTICVEPLPNQLLNGGRIFIPLRGGTARGQPPQLDYLSGSLVDSNEMRVLHSFKGCKLTCEGQSNSPPQKGHHGGHNYGI